MAKYAIAQVQISLTSGHITSFLWSEYVILYEEIDCASKDTFVYLVLVLGAFRKSTQEEKSGGKS